MIKYLDYIFVLRPVLMVPVWTVLLLGHHQGSRYGYLDKSLFWLFLLFTLFIGGAYLQNQIYDLETDRKNKKLFFLAEGYIPLENARKFTLLLYLFSVIPAYFLSLTIGLIFTLGFFFSFFYSTPPFSWKNKTYSGFLSNLISYGSLLFIAGFCARADFSLKVVLLSLPYALAVGAIYINTTLSDIEGDRLTGKITWGVKFGIFNSLLFSTFLVFISIITALIFLDIPFLISALLSFPFYIFALLTQEVERSVLATKVSILFLSLAAGYFYSWYFIILILGFIGTRLYYKQRFNLEYPKLF
ncbi:MAG: UbiA family prenyltransferase [candidate division Zixibacteria bacterium]|nr:UbiA family prenyltransferase [candidate division Zixibacteria bacterium]